MQLKMDVAERFTIIRNKIPAHIKIVAVSKTYAPEVIMYLYQNTGHTIFGENKAQELSGKHAILPNDLNWHFIGHLQTNKVKIISPYVSLVQSVDSLKVLAELNKSAQKCNRVIPCLLQFHIAKEEAKFGFSIEEATTMLEELPVQEMGHVSIIGVMGMATFTKDSDQVRSEFRLLRKYYEQLKSSYFVSGDDFKEISMGMSDDYHIAIDEGSTIVRIGSGIFGYR